MDIKLSSICFFIYVQSGFFQCLQIISGCTIRSLCGIFCFPAGKPYLYGITIHCHEAVICYVFILPLVQTYNETDACRCTIGLIHRYLPIIICISEVYLLTVFSFFPEPQIPSFIIVICTTPIMYDQCLTCCLYLHPRNKTGKYCHKYHKNTHESCCHSFSHVVIPPSELSSCYPPSIPLLFHFVHIKISLFFVKCDNLLSVHKKGIPTLYKV